MPDWVGNERILRWGIFSLAFLGIALWETYRPFRQLKFPNARRWAMHIVMAVLNNLVAVIAPLSALMVAIQAQSNSFGLLNHPWLPFWLQCILAVVALDWVRWAQHFVYHRIPFFWRFHRVHHADGDYDLTTTLRFHPVEVIFSQGSYLAMVYLIAPPPTVAIGFDLFLQFQNFFSHANVDMPARIERRLRKFLVTPDMHRIHHSTRMSEQSHNLGSIFPWWDRLFGTYQTRPEGHLDFGLSNFQQDRVLNLWEALVMPLRRQK